MSKYYLLRRVPKNQFGVISTILFRGNIRLSDYVIKINIFYLVELNRLCAAIIKVPFAGNVLKTTVSVDIQPNQCHDLKMFSKQAYAIQFKEISAGICKRIVFPIIH